MSLCGVANNYIAMHKAPFSMKMHVHIQLNVCRILGGPAMEEEFSYGALDSLGGSFVQPRGDNLGNKICRR